ncbi:GAF domain-containing protein [Streptomyces sp. YIM 98790]|uniref:GAF domain-containing sensor histidine kinase n=1 Tax=Streptomyces sp. YIM 98790 TaxID=2689077 RepID=UPI001A9ED315|nr:GAF domain-containing protein [Streptomyces sp. YIM 98790]
MAEAAEQQDGQERSIQRPPALPQLRLDQLLDELQLRLDAARHTQNRMHSLLEAVLSVGRELELDQVLRRIVEAATTLTDARYGALGVIGDNNRIAKFLTVGISDELARKIGPYPSGHGILGELIRHPHPLRLADLSAHPASYGFPAHHPPMHSFLGVPIRVRDEVFGNLYLTEKRGGAEFDADDEAVLTTLSVAAGVAIDNARLYRESRRREQWLGAIGEIVRTLLSGASTTDVLGLIARKALEVAEADSACVLLPTADGSALRVEIAEGTDARMLAGLRVPMEDSLSGAAARTGEPAVTLDIRSDPGGFGFHGLEEPQGPVVAVPMLSPHEAARGALRLARRAGRTGFDDIEVGLLSGFAAQAALALEVARHRTESEQVKLLQDRDRIARDLHDLAIQRLFATGMTLQSAGRLIDRPEAADRVNRAVDDLDETIKIIRSTIFALRTSGDSADERSLRRRLTRVVNSASEVLGFMPALRMEGPVDTDVTEEIADHVEAVTAEALSNVARHAHARRADVALTVATEVVLTVTDDGLGVGSPARTGGLSNMRSRAEQLGGGFEVGPAGEENGEPVGTRLVWRVPLPAQ